MMTEEYFRVLVIRLLLILIRGLCFDFSPREKEILEQACMDADWLDQKWQ